MIKKDICCYVTIVFAIVSCVLACDIYITSKCPTPPAPTEHNANWTLYCNEVKDHIDCINKKLKTCKNVQEFGPALETIKWNIKVIIEQGRSHGCTDLVDKIKLPRVPRKKKPTDEVKTTTVTLWTEKTIVYIDPNCHKNLVDMYCERLDISLMKYLYNNSLDETTIKVATFLNDANCKKITKHNQCLQTNFRVKCEQAMFQSFIKMDKLLQQCFSKMKTKQNSTSANRARLNYTILCLINLFSFFMLLIY